MRNAEFCAVCRRESAAVPMSIGRRRPKCTCLRRLVYDFIINKQVWLQLHVP